MKVVTDSAGFQELGATWADVARRSSNCSAFATWEWVYTWMRHFGGRDRLNVVTILEGDHVVALVPLLRTRVGRPPLGFEMLLPIGAEHADYSGFLLGDQPGVTAQIIADYLDEAATSHTIVQLPRLVSDDPVLVALRERIGASDQRDRCLEFRVGACPYLDLAAQTDPAAEVARRKKRHDLPRLMRRLGERGEIEFRYHTEHDLDDSLREVMSLHERRWDAKEGEMRGLFASGRDREFAVEVVRALSDAGHAKVSLLSLNGTPITGTLGFEVGTRYHYHKPGFDPTYSSFAPGNLLIGELLDAAVERSLGEFNFGRGDAAYKARWADQARELMTVWLTRARLTGRVQRSVVYRSRLRQLATDRRDGPWTSLPGLVAQGR